MWIFKFPITRLSQELAQLREPESSELHESRAVMRHNLKVETIPVELEPNAPTIVESYRNFAPPSNFRHDVETLLRFVPQKYLVGLKTIVLTNRAGLTGNKRKQKVWSRNRKVRLADSLGSYSRGGKNSSGSVWLYVDNIVKAESSWWRWVPLLRYMMPAEVLYHEIGHHIHAVHRPIHEGRENVAENWGRKLWRGFLRKHYWYLSPFLYVAARVASPIVKRLKRNERSA
jgi:hypothetical protein